VEEIANSARVIRFGVFEVDLRAGELRKSGLKIKLQEQPFQVLAMLLQRLGDVVTREELQKAVWPADTFVDFDRGLNKAINKIREALGDSADNPRFVETLPRRGYRFVYPLDTRPVGEPSPGPANAGPPSPTGRGTVTAEDRSNLGAVREPVLGTQWGLKAAALVAMLVAGISVAWFVFNRSRPQPELQQRQLTANSAESPVLSGAISPDGKYLAYADGAGIHLKLIPTGEERDIPQPAELANNGSQWSIEGWFPDGTRFLANSMQKMWGPTWGPAPTTAWLVSVLGARPRKFRDDARVWSVSPDGSQVAFTARRGNIADQEVWVMRTDGEQPRRIFAATEGSEISTVRWSPDGQRLAYQKLNQAPADREVSIETRDLRGGSPVAILSSRALISPFFDSLLGYCWLPNGRVLYSLYEPPPNQKNSNLWEIMVDGRTGKATGDPRKITQWTGFLIASLSATVDGKRIAFARQSHQTVTLLSELEPNHRLGNSRPLTSGETDWVWDWAPDSGAVLFNSYRNGSWDIFRQALDQTSAEPVIVGPRDELFPRLSPDGKWLLYAILPKDVYPPTPPSTPIQLMRVPVSGGPPQPILEARGYFVHSCSTHPGGPCVVAERTPDRKELIFTTFDPLKGRGPKVATLETDTHRDWYGWNLSPDGSRLAVLPGREPNNDLRIFSVPGGAARDLIVEGWRGFTAVNWLADGRGMIISAQSAQGTTLVCVDLEGNAHALMEQRASPGSYAVASRDGRHLAISADAINSNIWMMEDF